MRVIGRAFGRKNLSPVLAKFRSSYLLPAVKPDTVPTVPNRISFPKGIHDETSGVMADKNYYQTGETHQREESFEEPDPQLRWPETGGIKTLLEVALVSHLASVSMPVLVEQMKLLHPAIVPEPFMTVLYVLLGIGLGAVIVRSFMTESFVSTRRFDEYDEIGEYLERERLDQRWFLSNGGLAVFGGLLVWVTYERFVTVFLEVADLLVIVIAEFEWMLTPPDALYVVGFLGGFSLLAIGTDRLVVGGLRRYVQRRNGSD